VTLDIGSVLVRACILIHHIWVRNQQKYCIKAYYNYL